MLLDGTNLIAVEVHQCSPDQFRRQFRSRTDRNLDRRRAAKSRSTRTRCLRPGRTTAGKWSGLTEAAFVVESPLAITEIMYNPPAPTAAEIAAGFGDKDLFEYIEITNTGAGTVSLADVRLVDGITFDFAAGSVATLAPGEFVVVVRNEAAFEARYGDGINVAGEYTGGLTNGGERVALEHGVGVTVEAVEYGDSGDWPGRAGRQRQFARADRRGGRRRRSGELAQQHRVRRFAGPRGPRAGDRRRRQRSARQSRRRRDRRHRAVTTRPSRRSTSAAGI